MRKTVIAIIEKEGKFLVIMRLHEPFKGFWALPGGHIDPGETPEQAVIKEVKEETNLDFKPEFFMEVEESFPEYDWHALVKVFKGSFSGEEKILDETEIEELKWVSKEEIDSLMIGFNHKKLLMKFWGIN